MSAYNSEKLNGISEDKMEVILLEMIHGAEKIRKENTNSKVKTPPIVALAYDVNKGKVIDVTINKDKANHAEIVLLSKLKEISNINWNDIVIFVTCTPCIDCMIELDSNTSSRFKYLYYLTSETKDEEVLTHSRTSFKNKVNKRVGKLSLTGSTDKLKNLATFPYFEYKNWQYLDVDQLEKAKSLPKHSSDKKQKNFEKQIELAKEVMSNRNN